jgi:hypothetical protein
MALNTVKTIRVSAQLETIENKSLYAYIDGRNAARRGDEKVTPGFEDSLCQINWECGYDDVWAEMAGGN